MSRSSGPGLTPTRSRAASAAAAFFRSPSRTANSTRWSWAIASDGSCAAAACITGTAGRALVHQGGPVVQLLALDQPGVAIRREAGDHRVQPGEAYLQVRLEQGLDHLPVVGLSCEARWRYNARRSSS